MSETDCTKDYKANEIIQDANCLTDIKGETVISGIVESCEDITQEKSLIKALKESEEKYKDMADLLPQVIYESDLYGNLTYVNNQAFKTFGYIQEDFLQGFNLIQTVSPEDRPRIKEIFKSIMRNKGVNCSEFTALRKDGSTFPIIIYSSAIFKGNRPVGLRGVIIDDTKRRKIEKEMKKLTTAVEQSANTIVITNIDGDIEYTNPKFTDITGYTAVEALGQNPRILNSGSQPKEYYAEMWQTISKGKIWKGEFHNKSKEGRFFWENVTITPIKDDKGVITNYLAVKEDITEKKAAEQALKDSEDRFKQLSNVSFEGTLIHRKGIAIDFNLSLARMFGYEREELLGTNIIEKIIPKEYHKTISENITKNYADPYEIIGLRKDGSTFYIEVESRYIHIDSDDSIRAAAIRDISERKSAERELLEAKERTEESEKRFRELFEKSGDPILIIENGNFTDCNQATVDLLKYSSKDDILNVHPSIVSPDLQPDGRKSTEKANEMIEIALEDGTNRFEWDHKKSNGEVFPVEVLLTAISNEYNKEVIHVVWRDITVRKKAELNLVAALEMAKESDQLKSAFLANMSHEIRTPMNGILGFSELLKEPGLSGDEKKNYISVIEQSGERMLNTINDLIEMSKLEAGQMYISITEVNVKKQLEYIYNFFKPEVDKKGLQFSLSTNTSGSDIRIKTDEEKLYGILTNLVKNAIKYTNEGSIEFGYQVKDNYIEFFVEDTGIGIPSDQQQSVFERFVQADMTKSKTYEGAGLGLAITKANVELLGGNIRVESEEEKGSTFYFTIPK